MSDTPRVGDEIEVTYRGRVRMINEAKIAQLDNGTIFSADADKVRERGGSIRILKRANNPSTDPIGTVRQHPDPEMDERIYVKVAAGMWMAINEREGNTPCTWADHDLVEFTAIGTIPPIFISQKEGI